VLTQGFLDEGTPGVSKRRKETVLIVRSWLDDTLLLSEPSKGNMDQMASLREMAAGPHTNKLENVEL